jgi:hypothetical protein
MEWLDGVMAVPAMRIVLDTEHKSLSAFKASLAEFIDELRKNEARLEIEPEEIWGYSISQTESGFSFELTSRQIVVRYTYHILEDAKAGSFPDISFPEVTPFSKLLDEQIEYIKKISNLIDNIGNITYKSVHIAAVVTLSGESIPPGLELVISHLGKPWEARISKTECTIMAEILDDEAYQDKCSHIFRFDKSDLEKGFHLVLDYSRTFEEPLVLESRRLMKDIDLCKKNAEKYFQRIGEGDLSYE